jgi:uncharacterized protein with HEPN domain
VIHARTSGTPLRAAELLAEFSSGKSFTDYLADAMLRSAVERQFEIIGEALNNLSKVDPNLAASIPDLPCIVAFRNNLLHGYASVDDALVWQVLTEKRPQLEEHIRQLLAELA